MNVTDAALQSLLLLSFAVFSKRLQGTLLTAPMLLLSLGVVFGEPLLGWLELNLGEGTLDVLAELTLVMVLFGDATRIDIRALRREAGLPVRLLGLGPPLTIVLGGAWAKLLLAELTFWEAVKPYPLRQFSCGPQEAPRGAKSRRR